MEIETSNSNSTKTNKKPQSLRVIILVASIAAGIQFGWALQLSLLTPYVQLLGISHTRAGFIWLCGPISGMLVQPIVGYHSDRCTSRFGRRRPFIAAGSSLVAIAVFLIGYAADLGHLGGDSLDRPVKPRAIAVFVVGFWILDVANNMLQGPCRALLADISGSDTKKMRTANGFYSFFMAVGNVLDFSAGSYTHLHKMFPFTITKACDVYCANLKSCFFLSIVLLIALTVLALASFPEDQISQKEEEDEDEDDSKSNGSLPFFSEMIGALRELHRPMLILLVVTCLNWIAWFPFLLFDTDWMGKEVYGGQVGKGHLYDLGVRAGALSLMLNSVVLGFVSLGIESLARALGGKVKRLWGIVNFLLALCLAMTVLITKLAQSARHNAVVNVPAGAEPPPPPAWVMAGALTLFALLGIPQAITYSVPFALASIFCSNSGAGQGLSLGVMNLAIVVPQMVVSVVSGPWDKLFGGGNLPAFVAGAVSAVLSGVLALTMLPSPPPDIPAAKNARAAAAAFH